MTAPKKGRTPVAVVQEETGTFGLAVADNVPGDAPILVVIQRGAKADAILGALRAVSGFELSYSLPVAPEELARRWPASSGRVERFDLPMQLGAPDREAPAPRKAARWETPDGPSARRERPAAEQRPEGEGEGEGGSEAARRPRPRHRDEDPAAS